MRCCKIPCSLFWFMMVRNIFFFKLLILYLCPPHTIINTLIFGSAIHYYIASNELKLLLLADLLDNFWILGKKVLTNLSDYKSSLWSKNGTKWYKGIWYIASHLYQCSFNVSHLYHVQNWKFKSWHSDHFSTIQKNFKHDTISVAYWIYNFLFSNPGNKKCSKCWYINFMS